MRGGRRRDGRGCRMAGAARPWEEGEHRELGHGAACEGGGGQLANESVAKADTGENRKMAWSSASCPNPSRFESGARGVLGGRFPARRASVAIAVNVSVSVSAAFRRRLSP